MRFLTLTLFALAFSLFLHSTFGADPAYARDDNDPKFTNTEATAFVGERYVDGCMKQYMGMYRTDTLTPEQQLGFKQHAKESCQCMLVQARLQFSPREMADVSRICCANLDEFITPDNDEAAAMNLHMRYIKFFMDSDASRSCGLVVYENTEQRLYKSKEEYERAVRRNKGNAQYR